MLAALATVIGVFQPAPCALEGLPADFEQKHAIECGWVAVPLRKDAVNGRNIRLWTARIRATGTAKLYDPILYINGGPGIATVDAILPAITEIKSLSRLRQTRDIILFDQRGSGRSEESLCPDLAKSLNAIEALGLDPATEDARSRAAYAGCRAQIDKAGQDLEAYTTRATVADIDSLRQAFGVEKWNLLAISYGSLVAMDAMRQSPASIRSVILNSPYPPNSVTWAEMASSAAAAYTAIDRECAAQPECVKRHGSLVPKLEATLARLERTPLQDGETRITGRLFASALWPMAVRSNTVKFVPMAIDQAYSGDDETIRKMVAKYSSGDSFGGYSPAQAFAINCFESGRTTEWYGRARRLYPALVSAGPDDGWDQLCATYRPGFADPTFFAPVASDIPTLIYAGSLDPATPTIDAYQAMRFLTRATLVEVPGAAHGPMGLDECTLGIATAFLDKPNTQPDRACMATRKPIEFAIDGLDKLLAPAE